MNFPKITITMPTFNSESRLEKCLKLIRENDYPQEGIEIIIADGGSTDKTIEIAKKYNCVILNNEKKLPEPGKAVGIKNATGELICFLDDDNFVEDREFFKKMIKPFEDREIIAAEPWEYTYQKNLKPLERYWAMMGLNDPLMFFIGCFAHNNKIVNKWTSLDLEQQDKGDYIKIKLSFNKMPALGANGFIIKTEVIRKINYEKLLDLDKMAGVVKYGYNNFAKVKCGLIHTFASNFKSYLRKSIRKANSFYGSVGYSGHNIIEKTIRVYNYPNLMRGIVKFSFSTITLLPILYQSFLLFFKMKDFAAFLHIPVCYLTLIMYGQKAIKWNLKKYF